MSRKKNKGDPMLEEDEVNQLKLLLTRIFAMPITKSTFKEIQSGIYKVANENVDRANKVLETFLSGSTAKEIENLNPVFQELFDKYSIPIRLSKDILERGDFLSS